MAMMFCMDGHQLIGLTLLPQTLIGSICNWTVFYSALHIKSLSPSFAFLTGILALFDAIFSVLYFVFVGLMIVFDIKLMKTYSHESAFVLMVFNDAAMELHLVISLNRFFAVFTPILYRDMFDLKKTKIYAAICFGFTFVNLTFYSKIFGCRMFYNDELWMFFYDEMDAMCTTYSWIVDYAKGLGQLLLDAFINVIVIFKVAATKKQMRKTSVSSTSNTNRKKEMDFLKQTCIQGFVSLFATGIYYFIPENVTNKYLSFMLTTFLLCSLATCDGITSLVYNSEIRNGIFKKKDSAKTSIISVSSNASRKISTVASTVQS